MFGELIGLWMAAVWQQMGAPENVRIVELGPGRGTLMVDALRAAKSGRRISTPRSSLHLVEISPALQAAAGAAACEVSDVPVLWHARARRRAGRARASSSPTNSSMRCRCIRPSSRPTAGTSASSTIAPDGDLDFGAAREPLPHFETTLPRGLRQAPDGSIYEWRADSVALELGRRVRDDGAALIIDYGHARFGPGRHAAGGRRPFLHRPVARAGQGRPHRACRFRGAGAMRRERWARASTGRSASAISSAPRHREARGGAQGAVRRPRRPPRSTSRSARLIAEGARGMGELFKAIAIADAGSAQLPGFEPRPHDASRPQSLALDRHPPRLLHARRAASPAASMPASMAASARATTPNQVAENRARMAAALGVEPRALPHRLSDPFARTSSSPKRRGPAETRPRADAIVTRTRALAIGVTTADCGPILFADPKAARDRRRACRLARRAGRRHRGDRRGHGAARRRSAATSAPPSGR